MGVPGVGGAGVRGAAAPVGVFRVLPGRVTGSLTALSRVALIFRPNVLGRSQLSWWVQLQNSDANGQFLFCRFCYFVLPALNGRYFVLIYCAW